MRTATMKLQSCISSPPSLANVLALLLASTYIIFISAIDVEFDRIQCDQSLPVYAEDGDVFMTCNDGSSTRCTFGQDIMIRGTRK